MSRPSDVEILPPDPDWQPPSGATAVVYEVESSPTGVASEAKQARASALPSSFRDPITGAAKVGDPRVLGRLLKMGWRIGLVLAVIAFLVWALKPFGPQTLPVIVDWLRDHAALGRGLVVLTVAAGVPFFVPVGPMAFIPGYLWGTAEGVGLTLLGATLGGLINFELSRRYIGPHVLAWARTNKLASVLSDTINARGIRVIFGMRLSPLMPFGLLAYLSGLVAVPRWAFAVVVTVGGTPWTSVYAILGSALAASNRPVELAGKPDDPLAMGLMWFGLAVTIVVALWIGRVARRQMLQAAAPR